MVTVGEAIGIWQSIIPTVLSVTEAGESGEEFRRQLQAKVPELDVPKKSSHLR